MWDDESFILPTPSQAWHLLSIYLLFFSSGHTGLEIKQYLASYAWIWGHRDLLQNCYTCTTSCICLSLGHQLVEFDEKHI